MISKYKKEKLAGKKVIGLKKPFSQGDEVITFLCENGESFKIWCDGDCCSHSWFEHVEMPEFPFTIQKVEEIAGEEVSHPDHECLQVYGLKMETDRGHVDIEMRNSSNGFYGGSFNLDSGNLK